MTRQQHQHPSQGTSSLSPREGDRRDAPSQAAQQSPAASASAAGGTREHGPSNEGMNTDHRASHVSSTDSDRFGNHASLGGIDERGEHGGAAQSMGHGGGSSGAPERPQASPAQRQPTRGGAQTGLTGSISQLEHGHSQGDQHDQPDQGDRSKYSPTANEQDRLSQQQGGESLRSGASQRDGGARAESSQFAQPPGGRGDARGEAMDASSRSATPRVERPGAQGGERSSPRQGPQSDNDSPVAAPEAPRGKQTATRDIDLAGPDRSGTARDR
jgi:hypothetical protein